MAAVTSYTELSNPSDCAGLLENGKCKWLDIPSCPGIKCGHYKKADILEKVYLRLRSLDEKTQEHIANKYYGGTKPWCLM